MSDLNQTTEAPVKAGTLTPRQLDPNQLPWAFTLDAKTATPPFVYAKSPYLLKTEQLAVGVSTPSANFTISPSDRFSLYSCTAGAGGITCTLPDPTKCAGMIFTIVKADSAAGFVTLSGTVGGSTAQKLYAQYDWIGIVSDGTSLLVMAKHVPLVDLSSASSDYALAVGETAVINFSSATSIPLHIATADGMAYDIDISLNHSVADGSYVGATFINPNNTSYASSFNQNVYGWNSGGAAEAGYTVGSAFYVAGGVFSAHGKIFNYTLNKSSIFHSAIRSGSTNYWIGRTVTCTWGDTVTPYISLGTLVLGGGAASGKVIVRRVE